MQWQCGRHSGLAENGMSFRCKSCDRGVHDLDEPKGCGESVVEAGVKLGPSEVGHGGGS